MSATETETRISPTAEAEPCLVLDQIRYDQYQAINDAFGDRHNPRMIFANGRLILLSPSRLHDWFAWRLDFFVAAVATGCGIELEVSGSATYRHPDRDAGAEGDRAYYFAAHAELMRGPQEIDLTTQPPPDLVIEVEHTHPADHAVLVWGRIGVPEVWRYNVRRRAVSFWSRRDDGSYVQIEESLGLPGLKPADVDEQMRLAESLGTTRWLAQLNDWVRDALLPRRELP